MLTDANEERRVALIVASFAFGALLFFLYGIARYPGYGLDETNYVGSARALIDSTSTWKPDHPPLGKSLIAVGIRFLGDNPVGWRVSSAVAGSLTLAAIMLLTYAVLHSTEYMVIAGLLTLFDNFLFVMSRIAMLDAFLMLFLFWGYLFFLAGVATEYDRRTRSICLVFSGLFLGLATACKWNGLFSIAALTLIGVIVYLRQRNFSLPLLLVSFSVVPATAYSATFLALFRALGKPFTLSNLAGAQVEMYYFMKAIPGNPYLNVPWYRWPFHMEPTRALNFLVGNYAVTFGGFVALGFCIWRLTRRFDVPELTVITLYFVNWLQWLAIPRKLMCYYYYYPCTLLLGLALALTFARWDRKLLFGMRISLIPVIAAIVVFLFCFPHMASLQAPWDTALGYWR